MTIRPVACSGCGKKKEYTLDARVKGGERHMIMSGEYDKVLPMDIYGEYLIKYKQYEIFRINTLLFTHYTH